MRKISILGSTGSIGTQALAVLKNLPDYQVTALTAGTNISLLLRQIQEFKPRLVSVARASDAAAVRKEFPSVEVYSGADGLSRAATSEADIVLAAVVGTDCLVPVSEAIKQKKDIALANKELLVTAGELISGLVQRHGVKLLPVDSEHSAIMQSCPPQVSNGYFNYPVETIRRLILTASGGAFRETSPPNLPLMKAADALRHPNWQMGRKVTIDSATLVNKGLEVIEAHWLFGMPYAQIEVLIHPQSIVHSLVEYRDGSVLAQLGTPDMRLPIQYALAYPDRLPADYPKLDLLAVKNLTFQAPDWQNFRGLRLAYEAGQIGGTMPAVFNAANEAAVELFCQDKLKFTEIPQLIEDVMQKHVIIKNPTLDAILAAAQWAKGASLWQKVK
ncbi:1-deoxy-D-xylulose 5-phosphate reductoisomerase [Candidatus Termititenax persephonae]|uniref:1-deoxy-D-xylulose 5-phosphate reductoisomerase n=1 Tax=Candidatus Termititenax persephonae TaxID=2218525 RepID=A0A388TI09_9BACT|nr:1-deoxy-D-xylulose 5-phosphate reductoisomerase [Candidatus Termititenax persephonae]